MSYSITVGLRAKLLVVRVSGGYNVYLQQYLFNWEPHEEPTEHWHNLSMEQVIELALNTKM